MDIDCYQVFHFHQIHSISTLRFIVKQSIFRSSVIPFVVNTGAVYEVHLKKNSSNDIKSRRLILFHSQF